MYLLCTVRVEAEMAFREICPALSTAQQTELVDALVPQLSHPTWQARHSTLQALMAMPRCLKHKKGAIAGCLSDPHPFIRACAAEVIGCCGPPAVDLTPLLLTALEDSKGRVRAAATRGIAGLYASKKPKEKSPQKRRESPAEAGGGGVPPAVMSALEARLLDPEKEVRAAAAVALGDLGEAAGGSLSAVEFRLKTPSHSPACLPRPWDSCPSRGIARQGAVGSRGSHARHRPHGEARSQSDGCHVRFVGRPGPAGEGSCLPGYWGGAKHRVLLWDYYVIE
jgi:hypothetical protein